MHENNYFLRIINLKSKDFLPASLKKKIIASQSEPEPEPENNGSGHGNGKGTDEKDDNKGKGKKA